jgi:CIC family chloride channel protein
MDILKHGIPVSVSLNETLETENFFPKPSFNKKRLITIAALAIVIAICISFVAKFLIYLISFVTNISFYGNFSIASASPANNTLGIWVIIVPAIGGLIVGLMALYGSKAIRGHGIPEAMEQILTNQSKIKPSIMYLKPLSSAISIGTGGALWSRGPDHCNGWGPGIYLRAIIKNHTQRTKNITRCRCNGRDVGDIRLPHRCNFFSY